jgi:uncharacterized protein (DUF433 family)
VRLSAVIWGHMAKRLSVIHSDPDILGGIPVFVGTRVPVQNLIDCLEAGDSLDEFIDSFPSVTRDQAVAALEIAREALEESAHSSR